MPDATNAVFSRGNAIVAHSGTYHLRASNVASVVTSEPLALVVSAFEVFHDLVPATAYLDETLIVFLIRQALRRPGGRSAACLHATRWLE